MPEVPPGYESRAMGSPGDVDLDLLFALLAEDVGSRRYEAATAAGHVADARPDRLRPHVADLLDALVDGPNHVLGESPWDTSVRSWLVRALHRVAAGYPDEVLPLLLDAAADGPDVRREGALRALARAADRYPEWFRPRLERVEWFLDEERHLQAQALRLLAAVATPRPEAVQHLVPDAARALETPSVRPEAARFLAAVAHPRPSAVVPCAADLRAALDAVEPDGATPVCHALFEVARERPGPVAPAERRLRAVLEAADHPTTLAAAKVLAELR